MSEKKSKRQRQMKFDERVDSLRVGGIRKGLVSASNVGQIRKKIYQSKKDSTKKE